jgi:mono/diheme cytochrome c family protein
MFGRTRAGLLSVAILPLGVGLAVQSPQAVAPETPQAGPVSFSRQIAPIFQAKCAECHGAETQEAGLNLSTYELAMKGSEYGTVIEAGDADGSLLVEMVAAGEMPQDGDPLPAEEIALIRAWIEAGATNN